MQTSLYTMQLGISTAMSELPPRERLIDTANALFARDGYHATGIDRILAEAGVAKKTLYTHFRSKD